MGTALANAGGATGAGVSTAGGGTSTVTNATDVTTIGAAGGGVQAGTGGTTTVGGSAGASTVGVGMGGSNTAGGGTIGSGTIGSGTAGTGAVAAAGAGAMGAAGAGATALAFANFTEAGAFFGATCGLMGCHDMRYPPALSNSELSVLEETLSTYTVDRCGGLPLVAPGNPDGSALLLLLTDRCTELLMPFGCNVPAAPGVEAEAPCVGQADIDRLRAWISGPTPFL